MKSHDTGDLSIKRTAHWKLHVKITAKVTRL